MEGLQILNRYFDKIYVLTVEQAKDRQAEIKQNLEGLQFEFYFGIYKDAIDILDWIARGLFDQAKAKEYSRFNYEMKKGEIACSFGHRSIYEDVLKNNYRRVLILEDDARIETASISNFQFVIDELPDNWDILFLDYDLKKEDGKFFHTFFKRGFYRLQRLWGGMKFNTKMIQNFYSSPYSAHLRKAGYHYFADAYGLSNKACRELIKLQTPIVFPADHVLPWAITNEILNGYICIPKIFYQTSATNNYRNSLIVEK